MRRRKAGVRPDTASRGGPDPLSEANVAMVRELDAFLDELAEGHRRRMEDVVGWIERHGSLDEEIASTVKALQPLFQRWSVEICFLLRMRGVQRFNELKSALRGIGSRTLSQRLKDLETQGIVRREAFAEVPVRVEYSLTPKGHRMADLFMPVVAHLRISRLRERGLVPESR
ncbi:MAG: winged helix-turn-helix transcriptional regulator [Methanobacteriota archaeon]